MGVSGDAIRNAVSELMDKEGEKDEPSSQAAEVGFGPQFMGAGPQNAGSGSDDGSMLEQFGRNLTASSRPTASSTPSSGATARSSA